MAAVFALIENNNRILLVQRALNTSRPNQWCLPGGGVKQGESLEAACIRETKEETGLTVEMVSTLAAFDESTYLSAKVNGSTDLVGIPNREVQRGLWSDPEKILDLGEIMELARLIPLLKLAQLSYPETPEGLKLVSPNSQS